jgi:hypothetical protein
MIFESISVKYTAMKRVLLFFLSVIVISSCSATKESKSSRVELRKEKKLYEEAVVKSAVESRRFIIKFDRIYSSHGGSNDLIPQSNYIIVDGEKAIFSAAYIGRQFDIRPIAGINLNGRMQDYKLTRDIEKGKYEVNLKVARGGDSFDIYLTIGNSGTCTVSLSGSRIDIVRYRGSIVPIGVKTNTPEPMPSDKNQQQVLL